MLARPGGELRFTSQQISPIALLSLRRTMLRLEIPSAAKTSSQVVTGALACLAFQPTHWETASECSAIPRVRRGLACLVAIAQPREIR